MQDAILSLKGHGKTVYFLAVVEQRLMESDESFHVNMAVCDSKVYSTITPVDDDRKTALGVPVAPEQLWGEDGQEDTCGRSSAATSQSTSSVRVDLFDWQGSSCVLELCHDIPIFFRGDQR